ncbi:molecular chaperone [Klebsiella sp. BIGb0407]|uniref:fimbrial biogenesis chaperone n=1 Tax=Klebsiella sp. BIGb0407 TaxID=2940603 RepID=UPI00216A375E|nr:molecular chaperone [Klebsiella sp. BIGb0407]MCS3429510.1 P pilus assembly chaperone PapD [Klebsiella sp. BIGb0407]
MTISSFTPCSLCRSGGYLLVSLMALYMGAADAVSTPREGITLQSTRVIYPEDKKKGITFTLKNDSRVPYLIQSRVVNAPSSYLPGNDIEPLREAPFITLPPLKRLDADEQLSLTIRLTKANLPADRESVFALQIKAIPTKSDSEESTAPGQVNVMLALQNTLKLFYRPQQLPVYTVEQIADKLRFVKQDGKLNVSNSTPYYVTFKSLTVGNTAIDENALFQMVAPFGQLSYPLPVSASGEIRWQLINDYGYASEIYRRPLTQ